MSARSTAFRLLPVPVLQDRDSYSAKDVIDYLLS